ncbi:hypothetical protein [Microbacterium allomyrinae]|uniref:Uncharacterized protein n=1 Tax=Microbacterium allomyrinae TaxID=2830666 RepID=A0A9X1LRR5_9MICO|nr:hypothetical protein [Microbacterium allomyrinae]MCC2030907.1 hypothetical protein [Microbacterium allomyrinae]
MQPDPFALPAFILSIISLVVAVIGALTGIVALVWQIITRTRGAHRVTVNVTNAVLVGYGSPDGVMLCVEAINKGASAVRVTTWGFELPDGGGMVVTNPMSQSTVLPHMLDGGTNAQFFVPAEFVGRGLRDRPGLSPRDLRAFVKLATGETVYAKRKGIPLADDFWR